MRLSTWWLKWLHPTEWNTWLLSLECHSCAICRRHELCLRHILFFIFSLRYKQPSMTSSLRVEWMESEWIKYYIKAQPSNFSKNRVQIIKKKIVSFITFIQSKLALLRKIINWFSKKYFLKNRLFSYSIRTLFDPIQNRFHNLMDLHWMYAIIWYSQFYEIVFVDNPYYYCLCNKIQHPMQEKQRENKVESIANKLSSNQLNSPIFRIL